MIIGVLGIQGNLEEHETATLKAMEKLRIEGSVIRVKDKETLAKTDGLIISGGESTTMWKLLRKTNLFEELQTYKKPIFGTCAGLIILAHHGSKDSEKTGQEFLSCINAKVNRNAFGRQRDSFSVDIEFDNRPFHAVFIRAPVIEEVGEAVKVLATYKDKIIAARGGDILVTSFHPELTDDTRVHEYFLQMVVH